MPPTPEQTRAGYSSLWNRATVRPQDQAAVRAVADKIVANKARYQAIERATGVPWFMIGPIHNRESSLRFNAHLHCGDPLTKRTVHVPKGRPAAGSPPFTWEESANDALTMAPHSLNKVKEWTVERILYETERYNGWGYLGKGNSPYLWASTSEYHGGKYVADHVYDKNAWDKQLGCVALLKVIATLDPDASARLSNRQSKPPPDLIPEDKKIEGEIKTATNARNGGIAAGGVGAGTKATVETPPPAAAPAQHVTMGYVVPIVIAFGVALALWAVVRIANKKKEAKENAALAWQGSMNAEAK